MLLVVEIYDPGFEWMHEGRRDRWALKWRARWCELEVLGETGSTVAVVRFHAPCWPLSCPMIPPPLRSQPDRTPSSRCHGNKCSQGDEPTLFSPSHWRQSVCLFLLYILLPATSPILLATVFFIFYYRSSVLCFALLVMWLLYKNSAWNKWRNCLHGQKYVCRLTGSLAPFLHSSLF